MLLRSAIVATVGSLLYQVSTATACSKIVYCSLGMAFTNPDYTGSTGRTCTEECNGNCCIGGTSCSGQTRFPVCADPGDGSCNGNRACGGTGENGGTVGLISGGSCIGYESCLRLAAGGGNGNGGTVGAISGGSCMGSGACRMAGSLGGHVGDISGGSCMGAGIYWPPCERLGATGGVVGNIMNSCKGNDACLDLANGAADFESSLLNCCTTADSCKANDSPSGIPQDDSCVISAWGATPSPTVSPSLSPTRSPSLSPTPLPTASPSLSPTVAGPWTLDYANSKANFTSGALNELEVEFFVGVGHDVTVNVRETCDAEAAQVQSSLYNKNDNEMVSHVPGEVNITHSKVIVGYTFDKAQMINSSLWNATSEILTFCQITSLTMPDPSDPSNNPAWVMAEDRRKIEIQFDLNAAFSVDVDLAGRTIFNQTQTVDFDNDVESYKCVGGRDNSFNIDGRDLAPNMELAVCLRISNNTSVNIDRLANMKIAQAGASDFVVVEDGRPTILGITRMPQVSDGVIVKTMVPVNRFDFENGNTLNISGVVDLVLAGSNNARKLRALAGERDVAGEGREKAGYAVTVNLQSTADASGPIGSSDGHVIFGKSVAVLGLLFVPAFGLMM